jgi:hypothetical protein
MNKHSYIYCICIWHTHTHKHTYCHSWATCYFLWFKASSLALSKARFRKEVVNETSSTYKNHFVGGNNYVRGGKQNISQRDAINCHTFTDRGEQVGSVGSGQKTTSLLLCTRAPSKACVSTARPKFCSVNYREQSTVKLFPTAAALLQACTNSTAVSNGNPRIDIYDFCLSSGTLRKWERDRWYRQAFETLRHRGCVKRPCPEIRLCLPPQKCVQMSSVLNYLYLNAYGVSESGLFPSW